MEKVYIKKIPATEFDNEHFILYEHGKLRYPLIILTRQELIKLNENITEVCNL